MLHNTHQTHKEVCFDHTEPQEEATIQLDSLAEKAHLGSWVHKGARPDKQKPLLLHKKADRTDTADTGARGEGVAPPTVKENVCEELGIKQRVKVNESIRDQLM